jgi:hypothetical protein
MVAAHLGRAAAHHESVSGRLAQRVVAGHPLGALRCAGRSASALSSLLTFEWL